jgi:hypothetical protein
MNKIIKACLVASAIAFPVGFYLIKQHKEEKELELEKEEEVKEQDMIQLSKTISVKRKTMKGFHILEHKIMPYLLSKIRDKNAPIQQFRFYAV